MIYETPITGNFENGQKILIFFVRSSSPLNSLSLHPPTYQVTWSLLYIHKGECRDIKKSQ